MTNAISWFELPVTDLDRAGDFYSAVFGTKPSVRETCSPLFPVALLLLTGLYLFVLPYATRWRSRQRTPRTSRLREPDFRGNPEVVRRRLGERVPFHEIREAF